MNKKLISLIAVLALLGGCVTVSESGYYWGKYANSYYKVLKAPEEKNVLAHEENLRVIIKESEERNLRVPPGIQAELGYLVAKREGDEAAAAYFQKEAQLYPESKVFLERLISKSSERSDSNDG